MSESDASSPRGESIGPFRIQASLGAGGMGVVYRARDERLHRSVALKLIADRAAGEAEPRERLLREARTASSLNHPNICTVYEVGESDGRGWIAMELVEGRPLREMIPAGGMSPGEVIRYGIQIADALTHAHERSVVHRDLKTSNVMVTPEGRAKVLDFGLAKQLDATSAADVAMSLTQTGFVVGTPQSIPPEVLLGGKADALGDLWSVGVMLYEMLAGAPPFQGATVMAVCSSVLHDEPLPLPDRVPAPLRDIVRRLLIKDPKARLGSATELRRELEALASGPLPFATTASMSLPRPRPRMPWVWTGAGVAAAIVVVWGLVRFGGKTFGLDGGSDSIRSLAVLPLANLSGDRTQDYFADGMTEELITQLAPIEGLKVISRTSSMQYKGTHKSTAQIARELGVDAVVEGSVLRSGDKVRITAQLIDGGTDRHLWAESYERDMTDVLALQGSVARDIASKISVELTPAQSERMTSHRAVDPVAYELYLRGRYDWSTLSDAGVRRSIAYFQQAIKRDSTDARFYSGVADAYLMLAQVVGTMSFGEALPQLRRYAEKALALDPHSAEAQTSIAIATIWSERDWTLGERYLKSAIEINPGYTAAHLAYAALLSVLARHDEAVAEGRKAIELDPLSIVNNYTLVWELYHARRYEDALKQARRVRELDPNFPSVNAVEARIYERTGRWVEAARRTTHGSIWGFGPEYAAALEQAAKTGGAQGYWRTQLEFAHSTRRDPHRRSDTWLAYIYAGLGQKDSAFAALDRAVTSLEGDVLFMGVDPALDPLRSDPRMTAMLERLGLPH